MENAAFIFCCIFLLLNTGACLKWLKPQPYLTNSIGRHQYSWLPDFSTTRRRFLYKIYIVSSSRSATSCTKLLVNWKLNRIVLTSWKFLSKTSTLFLPQHHNIWSIQRIDNTVSTFCMNDLFCQKFVAESCSESKSFADVWKIVDNWWMIYDFSYIPIY